MQPNKAVIDYMNDYFGTAEQPAETSPSLYAIFMAIFGGALALFVALLGWLVWRWRGRSAQALKSP